MAPAVAGGHSAAQRALLRANEEPPPPLENVLPGAEDATPEELRFVAESECEKGKLDHRLCAMSEPQINQLQPHLEKEAQDLAELAKSVAPPEGRAAPWTADSLATFLTKIMNASPNPAVRNLVNKAGEFADMASSVSVPAGLVLSQSTAVEFAKGALYLALNRTPPLGDLFALADAVASGNIEQGVVAVIGVAATAIGLVFPPAGAVIAVGLAIYNVGKIIWNFFLARPRDWIADPPGTAKELFESGANLTWTHRNVKGMPANLIFSENKLVATQSLLMNSVWTKYNSDRTPVTYSFPEGGVDFYEAGVITARIEYSQGEWSELGPKVLSAALVIWQDDKAHTADCRVVRPQNLHYSDVICGNLSRSVTIAHNKPATLEVAYVLEEYQSLDSYCETSRPCVAEEMHNGQLKVLSEGTRTVKVEVPFLAAII